MGLSFGSISTGLPKDIVQQIISAERLPIKQMEQRKNKIENKQKLVEDLMKLVGDLRGMVRENSTGRSFRELKYETNEDVLGVSIDKNVASPGNYQIEVLETAQKSSAITNGVEDKDKTYLGVGYLSYRLPDGEEKEVYVDEKNSSLSGIAKLINNDSQDGMHASVINDGSDSDEPWKLIISIDETGKDHKVEFPYLYFVDGDTDLFIDKERPAKNARIKLDGFEIQLPSNQGSELLTGVTFDLKNASPGEEFTLSITEDRTAIGEKLGSFIEKINGVLSFIIKQNTLDESSDTTRTLGGDITLSTLEGRLRSLLFTPIETPEGQMRVSDLGIEFQRNGLLALDQKKFEANVAKDFSKIVHVLTGHRKEDGGYVRGLFGKMDRFTNTVLQLPNGMLANRKRGLQSNIDQIDRQIQTRERLLEQKEKNLKAKFSRLEETVSKLRAQGSGLAALQVNSMNPVTQLGSTVS